MKALKVLLLLGPMAREKRHENGDTLISNAEPSSNSEGATPGM